MKRNKAQQLNLYVEFHKNTATFLVRDLPWKFESLRASVLRTRRLNIKIDNLFYLLFFTDDDLDTFIWDDYLHMTETIAASPYLFKKVWR